MTATIHQPVATFKPLPWQEKPWRDKSPVLLLTGSAGGGKSRLAAEKLHAYCLKYPGSMAIMLRKTRESTTNSIVLFMGRKIMGGDPAIKFIPSKYRFEYPNGSILSWGGMADERQREQIRSIGQEAGIDIAWMEEAHLFSEADFDELTARMRGKAAPWRQIVLTTNPDGPRHWVYRRLIQGGEASVHYSNAADNTHNPESYKASLATLSGVRGERLRDGKWVQAEGAVYSGWNAEQHLVKPFKIPPDWTRYRSIDFGYTNPFVCQWWAEDGDGRLYLYRELYRSQRIVEDHCKDINRLSQGEKYRATVCDHDAEDRATVEKHCKCGTVGAVKAVSAGIQAVEARLQKAGDGKPRLFIFQDALVQKDAELDAVGKPTCTAQEFPEYQWAQPREGKSTREEPQKLNDHGLDALRYMVMQLDDPGKVRTFIGW